MASTDKLSALAFAPSATEGEAVNAFLALRRAGFNPSAVQKVSDFSNKSTAEWTMKVPCKSFDAFFSAIVSYRDLPFYTFKVNTFRGKLLDRWDLSLKVFFDNESELQVFKVYLDAIFKEI